jgi:hypothetical protein
MHISLETLVNVELDGKLIKMTPTNFCKLHEDLTKFYNNNYQALSKEDDE